MCLNTHPYFPLNIFFPVVGWFKSENLELAIHGSILTFSADHVHIMDIEPQDYQDLQAVRDAQYRAEYDKWVSGLSAEERVELQAKGLDSPHIDLNGVGAPELDENRLSSSPVSLPSEMLEDDPGANEGQIEASMEGLSESLQDSLRLMIAEVFRAKDPDYTLSLIAAALRVRDCKPAAVAERHGKSEKWVKAMAQRMRDRLILVNREDVRALRRLAGRLISTANARLSVEVLALASGVGYQGISETEIGRRHNITRSAVSKRCVLLTDELGLPPSRAMRSEESRRIYSDAQFDSHRKRRGDCDNNL